MAAKIILHRKNEWPNRRRSVKVLIDHAEQSSVLVNDGSEEYTVEPGLHTLQCKMSWCTSPVLDFDVKDGERKFVRVRGVMKYYMPLYILAALAILTQLFFDFSHQPRPSYLLGLQLVLVLPFLFYNLYYITLAKKKYLVLEEDKDNIFN
jgi:hypothetical protein